MSLEALERNWDEKKEEKAANQHSVSINSFVPPQHMLEWRGKREKAKMKPQHRVSIRQVSFTLRGNVTITLQTKRLAEPAIESQLLPIPIRFG